MHMILLVASLLRMETLRVAFNKISLVFYALEYYTQLLIKMRSQCSIFNLVSLNRRYALKTNIKKMLLKPQKENKQKQTVK